MKLLYQPMRHVPLLLFMMMMFTLSGCGQGDDAPGAPGAPGATRAQEQHHADGSALGPETTRTADAADTVRIVILGDSLTAGFGVRPDQAYPALVEKQLKAEHLPVTLINAGVSGDTTAGGLRRVDWLLKQSPDIVMVALGGNDGLRGQDVHASEANLRAIIDKARKAGAKVLLAGMIMPPNYGPAYIASFKAMYQDLASKTQVMFMPFLLEGVGGHPDLNQADGIHPNAQGHQIVAERVRPYLEKLVRQVLASRKAEGQAETSPAVPAGR